MEIWNDVVGKSYIWKKMVLKSYALKNIIVQSYAAIAENSIKTTNPIRIGWNVYALMESRKAKCCECIHYLSALVVEVLSIVI